MLTEEEMWKAVRRRDKSADGMFWYGVDDSGVFCCPSCAGPTPGRDRVHFFRSQAEALAFGWQPCPRCGGSMPVPDNADREQLYTLLLIFDAFYAEMEQLRLSIRGCGFRKRRVLRLFREQLDTTPARYMYRVRLDKAKEKLRGGARNILDVALSCGFNSLSHFYEKFKEDTGLTPANYRDAFFAASGSVTPASPSMNDTDRASA